MSRIFSGVVTEISKDIKGPHLGLFVFFITTVTLIAILAPAFYWLDWFDPKLWKSFKVEWPDPWITALTIFTASLLFLVPLFWIWRSRVLDLVALTLAIQFLNVLGYFFFGRTAAAIDGATEGILKMSGLIVLINGLGFTLLFASIGIAYWICILMKGRLKDPPRPLEELDHRMVIFLRFSSLICAFLLLIPMMQTGVVPILAPGEERAMARKLMFASDLTRPFFLLGAAIMPFIVGGLVCMIIKSPRRAFGWDGAVLVFILTAITLTATRSPFAVSLLVTFCLLTMQYRCRRWVGVSLFIFYIFLWGFLAGFSSLIRETNYSIGQGNVLTDSFKRAYLSDSIIDMRDGAWVLSEWDFEPLLGKTYLGGAAAFVPSGIFPQKKQWHLGLTSLRIVGWDTTVHLGLRISFFGESFLNFGMAGVIGLAIILGSCYGILLRQMHIAINKPQQSLWQNLRFVIYLQMLGALYSSSDGMMAWAMVGYIILIRIFVESRWSLPFEQRSVLTHGGSRPPL